MSSCMPSFSVVPSTLMSRTKAIPKGFSDLSRAEGCTETWQTGADPPTVTLAVFNTVTGLHVGVCHTNKSHSLTVLGRPVSKHHPEVTAAHVFNGNRHLAGEGEKWRRVWIQDYKVEEMLSGGRFVWVAHSEPVSSPRRLFHYIEPQ